MIQSLLLLFLLALSGGDDTIPRTNRPGNFSGAAGVYTLQVRATPTKVRVEDPITLTVKIISQKPGPWAHPPQRDKLKLFPENLERSFFVEPLPEDDRFLAAENAWEFSWRLLPKSERVTKIPEPEFVYFRTTDPQDFTIAEGGRAIAIEVKPRQGTLLTGPSATQERLEQIVEGEHLLNRGPSDLVWWTIVIAGLLLPPLGCFGAYFLWKQQFPEAAERLRRRRSKALKAALARLNQIGPSAPPDDVWEIVVDYLRMHVPLASGEPTPVEAGHALLSQGLSAALTDETVAWLQSCDTARFAPDALERNWSASATQVLHSLEVELCAPASR
jgi:hypothetical protein